MVKHKHTPINSHEHHTHTHTQRPAEVMFLSGLVPGIIGYNAEPWLEVLIGMHPMHSTTWPNVCNFDPGTIWVWVKIHPPGDRRF